MTMAGGAMMYRTCDIEGYNGSMISQAVCVVSAGAVYVGISLKAAH